MCLLMYLRKEITEEILNNIFFKAITLAIRKLGISVGKFEGFLKKFVYITHTYHGRLFFSSWFFSS